MTARSTFIVGAGVIGLACAVEAQRRGDSVTIFDGKEPATGCSYGNAGIIAASEIFPLVTPTRLLNLPQMLLSRDAPAVVRLRGLPKLGKWMARAATTLRLKKQAAITEALVTLNMSAVPSWRELLRHCRAQGILRERGMLRLIRTPRQLRSLLDIRDRLAQHTLPSKMLDRDELFDLEPGLSKNVIGGLLHETDADIGDPFELCQLMLRSFLQSGGKVIPQNALEIRPLEGGADLIAANGVWRADQILVTAGLASGGILRPLGVSAPLQAERGYHLTLKGMGHLLARPVTFQEEYCVASPMGGMLRLAGTVEFTDSDASPDWSRAHRLATYASRYFHEPFPRDNNEVWMGSRPSLPDSLPAIGRIESSPAIGYAFGHQHLGVTQAAITAKLLTAIMRDEHPTLDVTPFGLTRF